jgi:hypothetical protein
MIDLERDAPVLLDPVLLEWMRDQLYPKWWHCAAGCRDAWSDMYFPAKGRGDLVTQARKTCSGCPVLEVCREPEELRACRARLSIGRGQQEVFRSLTSVSERLTSNSRGT